jgi:hypothetical protein
MENQFNRRKFVTASAFAGCALLVSGKLSAFNNFAHLQNEIPNPKKLNYCGYTCPKDCQFLEASLKNDTELKKKAYETWHIRERYNVDFDADKTFCFGCKNSDKPAGIVMKNCTVRSCAINKKFDSCIECKELKDCGKDLWTRFPDFKKEVIKMQTIYFENRG